MCEKLKEHIPRQMFEVPIQAAIGRKDYCKRNCKSNEKRCISKMLWWRYFKKEKAS